MAGKAPRNALPRSPVGLWAVHDSLLGPGMPHPAPEVSLLFTGGEASASCDLGRNLQTSGKEDRLPGTTHGPAQSAYRFQQGKNQQWVRQAARAPPYYPTLQQSTLLFPHPHDPETLPTSHMRLLFLQMPTCSGAMTRPVKGPSRCRPWIHVLEKMPRPSRDGARC